MIDFETARRQLFDTHNCTLECVNLALGEAANRVLAAPLNARYPSPLFDNSAMDGYAVCDTEGGLKQFSVVSRIQAGQTADMPLSHGQAVRIFTGAPLPANTSAVVPQEQTTIDGDILSVEADIRTGQHMRLKAEEIDAGQELLPEGCTLNAAALGLAASQGYKNVPVFARLKVIVFSSGNELTEPGDALGESKIYDANRYQLMALLRMIGAEVMDGGILPDDLARTEAALGFAAKKFDVIVTSGGASVGEADYLKQAIENVGHLTTHTLAIKPGKPFAWGSIARTNVFILPGNPVATFVTAHMLLLPVLNKMMGKNPRHWQLPVITAKAAFNTAKPIKRREFLRVMVETDEAGDTVARLLPNQGSAMLSTCARAHAFCEVPPGETISEGQKVNIHLLPD
ncbi:molybdopterin biosynthesis protein MoeA [Neisseria arctica]|uniref:Molybdopterin molybdenumtransferase n=1 Tax=Neisseria arctica TaxID=1470200 RepID=A0A0J0YU71_9NEIS|nr:gephyrin-like molybdotransferase Glp [Neisseria arctica]KLT73654.1 molybdopterin biosynthesis protein MoeA [Neisseria arctica]UOO85783.1 molybdopterin molybdotransferase MoeA [Neisseria arctica]